MSITGALNVLALETDVTAKVSPEFSEASDVLCRNMRDLRPEELADVLDWIRENHCYYVMESCDIKNAALTESARRLRS